MRKLPSEEIIIAKTNERTEIPYFMKFLQPVKFANFTI